MRKLDGVVEVIRNLKLDRSVAVILIFTIVGIPHGVPLIAGFVVLQQAEVRLIKGTKIFYVIVHYYAVMRENIWYGYNN